MFVDQFRRIRTRDVMMLTESLDAQDYLRRAPNCIITDFLRHMPQEKVGRLIAKNVMLIHPFLGSPFPNSIYELYPNQLDWIADAWRQLCEESYYAFGDVMTTPLLIGGGDLGTYVVDQRGQVHEVDI